MFPPGRAGKCAIRGDHGVGGGNRRCRTVMRLGTIDLQQKGNFGDNSAHWGPNLATLSGDRHFSVSRKRFSVVIVPRRMSVDSGGQSYGRCDSSPMMIGRPAKPWARAARAAERPARDAPTTASVSIIHPYNCFLRNDHRDMQQRYVSHVACQGPR